MQLIKATFEFIDNNGIRHKRSIEQEDAQLWYDWIVFIGEYLRDEEWYPNFEDLNWKISELKPKRKETPPVSSVLEQILEENTKKDK